jgi:hypothetical protein
MSEEYKEGPKPFSQDVARYIEFETPAKRNMRLRRNVEGAAEAAPREVPKSILKVDANTALTREMFWYLDESSYGTLLELEGAWGKEHQLALLNNTPQDQLAPVLVATRLTAWATDRISKEKIAQTKEKYFQSGYAEAARAARDAALAAQVSQIPSRNESGKIKIRVNPYRGDNVDENLDAWILDIHKALDGQNIKDERKKISFATSWLEGSAKRWCTSLELQDPNHFVDLKDFCNQIRQSFVPEVTEFQAKTKFLSSKQGKRDLRSWIIELQTLSSRVLNPPFPEDIKVSIFMRGINEGRPRDE